MTVAGLDDNGKAEFASILQTLNQKSEARFYSVLSSVYITDAERTRITDLTPITDTQPPVIVEETPDYTMTDGEMMNAVARGYIPSVMQIGSPEGLEITLTDDWTMDGLRSALYQAVNERIRGSVLENDLSGIEISYRSRFPEEMRDGITFTLYYYANYKDSDPVTLPSGTLYYCGGRTGELSAVVHLSGTGTTAPVSGEFAAGQEIYDQIANCVSVPISLSVSAEEESYDMSAAIFDIFRSELNNAGLSDICHLSSLSFGSHYNPVWCDPGYEQIIDFTVSVEFTHGTTIQHFTFTSTLTLLTTE